MDDFLATRQPDEAIELSADYRMKPEDRRKIDSQILAIQALMAKGLLNNAIGSWYVAGEAIPKGCAVVPSINGTKTVVLATTAHFAAMPRIVGVTVDNTSLGAAVFVVHSGMIPNLVTGLITAGEVTVTSAGTLEIDGEGPSVGHANNDATLTVQLAGSGDGGSLDLVGNLVVEVFTASGTWTRPDGVEEATLFGVGGGGPGGGGSSGVSASNGISQSVAAGAGAGGGGAIPSTRVLRGLSSPTYDVQIGDGGTPGAGGAQSNSGVTGTTDGTHWNHGGDGDSSSSNDTTFGSLATFPGGAPGKGALFNTSTFFSAIPGNPVRGGITLRAFSALNTFLSASFTVGGYAMGFLELLFGGPYYGGAGGRTGSLADADTSANVSSTGCPGRPSPYTSDTSAAGNGGARGSASGGPGGGSSGGGGGSSLGKGGDGGAGGRGANTAGANGVAGSNGSEPPAGNYGAGGGGGGAGGNASFGGSGGAGAAGGSGAKGHKGYLAIMYSLPEVPEVPEEEP